MSFELHLELLGRLLLGGVLGAVIGYERDLHGRPAGLRTHAIVGLASSTFMVVSTAFVYFQHYAPGSIAEVDVSRIAASVVSGIGFLAGGAILRTGLTVQGLTTAAGLWLVAAIGLAAGGGMYAAALVATLAGVTVLTVLRRFEDKTDDRSRGELKLVLVDDGAVLMAAKASLAELGVHLSHEEYEFDATAQRRAYEASVSVPRKVELLSLVDTLEKVSGVLKVRVEPAR